MIVNWNVHLEFAKLTIGMFGMIFNFDYIFFSLILNIKKLEIIQANLA